MLGGTLTRLSGHLLRNRSDRWFAMLRTYEIRSGRRVVAVRDSVSPLQAVVDYARAFGASDSEIVRLGIDTVSWRGAKFSAVLPRGQDIARARPWESDTERRDTR